MIDAEHTEQRIALEERQRQEDADGTAMTMTCGLPLRVTITRS
ncbi:MAG: hypothetical protein ACRDNZ_05300 [Streptosporangiaceae bacterium]